MIKKVLPLLGLASLTFGQLSADTVSVDPVQRYQTFRGFGTCITPWVGQMIDLYETQNFQEIYAEELNLTLLRIDAMPYVHPEVSDPDDISYENFNLDSGGQQHANNSRARVFLDFAKATHAVNPNVRVLITAWSMPGWMKDNNSHLEGGAIKPSHYEHAAQLMIEYIKLFQSEGVPVLGVSFANEPQFAQFYLSQVMDPEPYADMLAVLGARMEEQGLGDVMIYGPEHMTHDTARNGQYARAINDHETAAMYMDAFASHGYTDGISTDPSRTAPSLLYRNVIKPNGWEFWMTESGTGSSGAYSHNDAIEQLAGMIQNHLVDANASVFTPWQVTGESQSEHNLMVMANHTPKSRVMQHYARTILPGMRRIHADVDGSTLASVFLDEETGDVGIVLLNANNSARVVDVEFPGLPDTDFTARSMTSANGWGTMSDVSSSSGELSVQLEGKSIISLLARDVDLSGMMDEDVLVLGDGTDPVVLPGYASSATIPVTAPEGYEWSAKLAHVQFAMIKEGTESGTGNGEIVIEVPDNYSDTDSRSVELDLMGRVVTIVQEPYTEPPVGESWWKDVTIVGGARETALLNDGEPGIGWIYDNDWPYVYSYSLGAWVYIMGDGDTSGFYAYRFDTSGWLWGSNSWGWYYDFSSGWASFNE